jgi:2-oxoglutarate ferredoxin oxidoreductase subunit beta
MIRKKSGHLPRPFGIFYIEERPTYEEAMAFQLSEAKKVRGDGDLGRIITR